MIYSTSPVEVVTGLIKVCKKSISSILSSFLRILIMPFRWISRINSSPEKNIKTKKVFKHFLWCSLILTVILILCCGGWVAHEYYYDDYLPEKQNKEAYKNFMHRFNTVDDDEKLDLAVIVCEREENSYYKHTKNELLETERFYNYIVAKAKNGNAKAQYLYGMILSACKSEYCKVSTLAKMRGVQGEYYWHVSNDKYYMPDTDTTCYAARTVYWFNEAATNGYPDACGEIGIIYEEGIGMDTNLYKAINFYKKGAALNDLQSQYRLGCMYRDGVVIENGCHWEQKSTIDSSIGDKDILIRKYWDSERSTDVCVYRTKVADYKTLLPKDISKAKYWWRKASEQGYKEATIALQQLYD